MTGAAAANAAEESPTAPVETTEAVAPEGVSEEAEHAEDGPADAAPTGALDESIGDEVVVEEQDPAAETGAVTLAAAASSISGTVTRASDGAPAVGVVSVTDAGGYSDSVDIGADGSYTISLAPGTYTLHFVSYEDAALSEYWPDARAEVDAVPITVAEEDQLVGIDAVLAPSALITGTIDTGDAAVYDRFVEAYDQNGVFLAMAYANTSGTYTLYVPAGTYIVRASAIPQETQADLGVQYFDHVTTAAEATPITVAGTEVRAGIDFSLGTPAAPAAPVDPVERPVEGTASTGSLAATGSETPVLIMVFAAMMLVAGGLLLSRGRVHV
ncbi:DUF1416 domain-containing protein [Microbacterium abyssi]|uniref:DUF1416 domain-containing protein n=1 Tax=Microbacterium abyssi TaxID=2782166 RepID=UPI001886CCA3|nr:DUF1416 domain-containing protein [Microbacterium sp. A18JL241]